MASLPTVGSSEDTWGTELNAFLLEAHNADGTQKVEPFPIGSSYITVRTGAVTGIANGLPLSPPPDWQLVGSVVGPDFEIDGTDEWKINVLNDCWIDLTMTFAFGTEDNSKPLTTFIVELGVNSDGNGAGTGLAPPEGTLNVENLAAAAGLTYWGETHRWPYAQLVAGDYISFYEFMVVMDGGGSWFIDDCQLQIMRVA